MGKKITTLITLVAFFLFTYNCAKTVRVEENIKISPNELPVDYSSISAVQTKAGEYIGFLMPFWAEYDGEQIKGYKNERIKIEKRNIVDTSHYSGSYFIIERKDGKKFLASMTDQKILFAHEYISIPLSDVSLVWIKRNYYSQKTDRAATTATAIVVTALVVVSIVGLVLIAVEAAEQPPPPTTSSCPFVYSFNGDQYVFNAEPYGGAYCQGLKRTEWCGLEDLKEVDGQYRILVTNELNETQYTDELKLVVVDHPKGVKVAPDLSGRIHPLSTLVTPNFIRDQNGKDLIPYISQKDKILWVSKEENSVPQDKEEYKDELIFEFPKPKGAEKVNFLVNACTTLWGSEAGKRYLELYGGAIDDWYAEIDNHGPAFAQHIRLNVREELFGLQIRVETRDGWKTKGIIRGGGPLISEDKVYPLNIFDVPGDTLRIKLTPPKGLWMIDHLAVDYTEHSTIQVLELDAAGAIDQNNQDVRTHLLQTDDKYLVMPNIGDKTELRFNAPPGSDNMDRSLFIKVSGYYDIHLESKGKPQHELLDRIHNEPGFAAQYSLQNYQEWKAKALAGYKQK